jgi:hypothetical protein
MRKIATLFLALFTFGASLADAAAQSRYPGAYRETRYERGRFSENRDQYRRQRYDEPRDYGRRHYRRGGSGDAVGAGILGLALGAVVLGALASQAQAQAAPPPPATTDPQLAAYCARRFPSYDPMSGTYLTRAGERIVCTY